MPQREYSQEEYKKDFFLAGRREKALEHALDIRKFEIELYWKRATYFWTFIGAAFVGFIAIQALETPQKQEDLSVIISCIGVVFSFAWLCVNRGSKHWQENWEKHVDLLEDDVTGPLYKVVLTRNESKSLSQKFNHIINGTTPFSVSKINQIISLYVTFLWVCLLFYSFPSFSCVSEISLIYWVVIGMSLFVCALFLIFGKSYSGGYWHRATIRTSEIKKE